MKKINRTSIVLFILLVLSNLYWPFYGYPVSIYELEREAKEKDESLFIYQKILTSNKVFAGKEKEEVLELLNELFPNSPILNPDSSISVGFAKFIFEDNKLVRLEYKGYNYL